jgi:hypothetical protein
MDKFINNQEFIVEIFDCEREAKQVGEIGMRSWRRAPSGLTILSHQSVISSQRHPICGSVYCLPGCLVLSLAGSRSPERTASM